MVSCNVLSICHRILERRDASEDLEKIDQAMKIQSVVMRARQILLVIALLFFLGFLASPGFVDSVTGDGKVTMLPGYGSVLWWAINLPYAVTHSRRDGVLLVSLSLTHVAFVGLPVLVALRRFRPLALRMFFCVVFVAGFVSMASLIGRSERVAFGVYLWLLAAVAAAGFCLLPRDDS